MKTLQMVVAILLGLVSSVVAVGLASAAETHVIEATSDLTWKSAEGESNDTEPLVVKVNKGDILEIKVPGGLHGFVTIDKKGTDNPTVMTDPVLACGQSETEENKGKIVLREIDCTGGESNFGKLFVGTLKLEVADTFEEDLNFWCVRHRGGMWGVIKLRP
jgi:hypothetical protein